MLAEQRMPALVVAESIANRSTVKFLVDREI